MELVKSILQQVVVVVFLVQPGADGDADQVQWEEQDGPNHAEPAGQERCRECDLITRRCKVGGLQELCCAHPGTAH